MVGDASSFWISSLLGASVIVAFQSPVPTSLHLAWQTVAVSMGGAMLFYVSSWVGGWRRYASHRSRVTVLVGVSLLGLWALYLLSATEASRAVVTLLAGAVLASTVHGWRDHGEMALPDGLVGRLGMVAAASVVVVTLKLTETFFAADFVVVVAAAGAALVFWIIAVTVAGARIHKAVALEWAMTAAVLSIAFAWFPVALGIRLALIAALWLWVMK